VGVVSGRFLAGSERRAAVVLYVLMAKWKDGLTREQMDGALEKRSQWKYPKGVTIVGEYWLSTSSPAVITVFEATEYEPIMEIALAWRDVFDITTVPATMSEEGLRIASKIRERQSKDVKTWP
jgi:hypothetical protein